MNNSIRANFVIEVFHPYGFTYNIKQREGKFIFFLPSHTKELKAKSKYLLSLQFSSYYSFPFPPLLLT